MCLYRGFGNGFSYARRVSLSSVGRHGSYVGCANPNFGMHQAPQLSGRQWIQSQQLHGRARRLRARPIKWLARSAWCGSGFSRGTWMNRDGRRRVGTFRPRGRSASCWKVSAAKRALDLRREAQPLKEMVADLALENRLLKKRMARSVCEGYDLAKCHRNHPITNQSPGRAALSADDRPLLRQSRRRGVCDPCVGLLA